MTDEEESGVEEGKRKFDNDFLLSILNALAVKILSKVAINCEIHEFVITVEDELIAEWNMQSGNPVVIRVQSGFVLKQLQKRSTLSVLAHGLQHAIEMVPRMKHTLSVVPVADVLWRTEEMRKWKKAAKDKALYYDKLIPEKEITYTELVSIAATHKTTGFVAKLTVPMSQANPVHMRSNVRKLLTNKVKNATTPERIRDSERSIDLSDILHIEETCGRTWTGPHSGFKGNVSASEWNGEVE